MNSFAVIVPTLNGGETFLQLLTSLEEQTLKPAALIVIDSGSEDGTVQAAEAEGAKVYQVSQEVFDHGGTRQVAVNMAEAIDVVVFLTQDAVLANCDALHNLMDCFEDTEIGGAYGRQLPHPGAGIFGSHVRLFNYPEISRVRSLTDADLGIKAAFMSNSFAAYRRSVLIAVGGFPVNVILGEDTYVAAKMLLAGWKISYCADACVYHSHDFSLVEEFRRYFNTGIFHNRESWLLKKFGRVEGEGIRYFLSEIKYCREKGKPSWILWSIVRCFTKYLAYNLGKAEEALPRYVKRRLSSSPNYWLNNP